MPIGRRLVTINRFRFQAWRWKMGPTGYPETSLTNCLSTLRNIPEERRSQNSSTLWLSYVSCSRLNHFNFSRTWFMFSWKYECVLKPAFLKYHVCPRKFTLWISNLHLYATMKHWVKQCNYCSRERYGNRERDRISVSIGRNNNVWHKRVDWHMYLRGRVYA
jgi:hypothetical protein